VKELANNFCKKFSQNISKDYGAEISGGSVAWSK
jgi:hypothetical protein